MSNGSKRLYEMVPCSKFLTCARLIQCCCIGIQPLSWAPVMWQQFETVFGGSVTTAAPRKACRINIDQIINQVRSSPKKSDHQSSQIINLCRYTA